MFFRFHFILLFLVLFPTIISYSQQLEFSDVTRLGNAANSPCEESLPLLAPDGKTLYLSRMINPENRGGANSGSDVWVCRQDEKTGRWQQADNKLLTINTNGSDAIVGISRNGESLYMLTTWPSKAPKGIYFIKKNDNGWSKPELIRIPGRISNGFLGAYVSPDFETIFLSMEAPGGMGQEDLYVTTRDSL
jgi:hypothetical protein